MPRFCLTFVSLLVFLIGARGLAQTAEESNFQRLPGIDPSLVGQPPVNPSLAGQPPVGQAPIDQPVNDPQAIVQPPIAQPPQVSPFSGTNSLPAEKPSGEAEKPLDLKEEEIFATASLSEFWGYRYSSDSLDWIPGGGNQLGMFSILWDHYQPSGIRHGLGIGMGFHFLGGPVQTDMPPRLFDFSIAYQIRQRIGPLAFDVASSVLAASDFEGNARKGILFPSHAVGYLKIQPETDLVFGIDYVDRGDFKILPVAGVVWVPKPELRLEMVFPRPRAVYQLSEQYRVYLSGDLGGGTWAIERVSHADDLATYRDLRVCLGFEHVEKNGWQSAIEVGYLFDRRVEYTSAIGNMKLDDAVLIRWVTMY
jgi:hypothetical protein